MSNAVFNVTPRGLKSDDSDGTFWQRPGRQQVFRGTLVRGEPAGEHQQQHEVELRPGFCISWTAMEGHCQEPADGLACAKHAEDFTPTLGRRVSKEEMAQFNHLSPRERALARKRLTSQRAREDPAYVAEHNRRKRERRRQKSLEGA